MPNCDEGTGIRITPVPGGGGGGGASITVDSALSDTSTNPVQNKVIKEALDSISAGGVVVDNALSTTSSYPVQNQVITNALNAKADLSTVTALQTTVNSKADVSALAALDTAVNSKADSSSVSALSTALSTLSTTVSGKADASDVTTALAGKVDAVSGMGLSSNDFTNADKAALSAATTKLADIEEYEVVPTTTVESWFA